jgi:hypothetical protein
MFAPQPSLLQRAKVKLATLHSATCWVSQKPKLWSEGITSFNHYPTIYVGGGFPFHYPQPSFLQKQKGSEACRVLKTLQATRGNLIQYKGGCGFPFLEAILEGVVRDAHSVTLTFAKSKS